MRQYKEGDRVWVGDKEYWVRSYEEEIQWDPFFSKDKDIAPCYRLVEVTGEYFANPTVRSARIEEVHHMPLRLRVRRIEEKLGLNDE